MVVEHEWNLGFKYLKHFTTVFFTALDCRASSPKLWAFITTRSVFCSERYCRFYSLPKLVGVLNGDRVSQFDRSPKLWAFITIRSVFCSER